MFLRFDTELELITRQQASIVILLTRKNKVRIQPLPRSLLEPQSDVILCLALLYLFIAIRLLIQQSFKDFPVLLARMVF